jgi:hypothetical protein
MPTITAECKKWPGRVTPSGSWTAKSLSRHHRSSRYDKARIPLFDLLQQAICHPRYEQESGRTRISGCIKLHPENAAELFSFVQSDSLLNIRMLVVEWPAIPVRCYPKEGGMPPRRVGLRSAPQMPDGLELFRQGCQLLCNNRVSERR